MDVLTAAWTAAGQPTTTTQHGVCARCSKHDHITPLTQVLSHNFTAWADFDNPGGEGLCQACTWAYTHTALRRNPHLVTTTPTLHELTRAAALEQLLTTADHTPTTWALLIPIRPLRQHLLPQATWGQITIDNATITWTHHDHDRLTTYTTLRAAGFTPTDLRQPAPPHRHLTHLTPQALTTTLTAWETLHPWRTDASPWLAVAGCLTTPERSA